MGSACLESAAQMQTTTATGTARNTSTTTPDSAIVERKSLHKPFLFFIHFTKETYVTENENDIV